MSKVKNQKNTVVKEVVAEVQNVEVVNVVNTEMEVVKRKGRPVVENSARQLRLKMLEEKRANGELKRGRPVVENSARQIRLNELEAKRYMGTLKKGRPVNENSARQMRLKDLEERRQNGTLKLGRPKMVKVEVVETEK